MRIESPEFVANPLSPALVKLARTLKMCATEVPDDERLDFTSASDRLQSLASLLEDWRCQREAESVYWIDASRSRRGRRRLTLSAAPLDVGPALRQQLFDKISTVVMTSATLTVGRAGSFDFFKSRIGLTQAECRRWGSPFDYPRQAELVLVDGMPDPTADKDGYERAVVEMIRRYVARTDGHAFVLFTSYDMMRRVAASWRRGWPSGTSGSIARPTACRAARCSSAFAPIRGPCCWVPTASGRAWTCRATRCKT